jgi:hypothetical protein
MEVSQVRRRVQAALAAARERSQQRRQRVADAEGQYDRFLADVAVPLARQVANVLKAEGRSFTVSTPGRNVRLEPDRGRDDFVEITLNTEVDPPDVVGLIRYTRGSRTIDEERPVKSGVAPDQISEDDLLEFLLRALEPWIER